VPLAVVRDLVKEYRTPRRQTGFLGGLRTLVTREVVVTRALDGIRFEMVEGEFVGYIGPNGAGKPTTIKILTGVLVPTRGAVTVLGRVPWCERERNALAIGVVFGQRTHRWTCR